MTRVDASVDHPTVRWLVGRGWQLYAAMLLRVMSGAAPALVALLTRNVIDELVGPNESTGAPIASLSILTLVTIAAAGLPIIAEVLEHWHSGNVSTSALSVSYGSLDRFYGVGSFENAALHDDICFAMEAGERVGDTLVFALSRFLESVTMMFSFGYVLARYFSASIAVVIVLASATVLALKLAIARSRIDSSRAASPHQRRRSYFADALVSPQAAKEVKAFSLGPYLREQMIDAHESLVRLTLRQRWTETKSEIAVASVSALSMGAILLIAFGTQSPGSLSAGDVALFMIAFASLSGTAEGLASGFAGLVEGRRFADAVFAFARTPSDLPNGTHCVEDAPTFTFEFDHVWFRYDEDSAYVLSDVSLVIPGGETTALVGANGSGKSTILKLMARLYDPTAGAIRLNGRDLRDYDVTELRSIVGATFQDFVRFDLSARENIRVGDVDRPPDDGTIHRLASDCGLLDSLERQDRSLSDVVSREFSDDPVGFDLSGGQWQRVALCRMAYRNSSVQLLDEPSASLDSEGESLLMEALESAKADARTVVIVTHRLRLTEVADHVALIEAGKVVESGRPADLLRSDSRLRMTAEEQRYSGVTSDGVNS